MFDIFNQPEPCLKKADSNLSLFLEEEKTLEDQSTVPTLNEDLLVSQLVVSQIQKPKGNRIIDFLDVSTETGDYQETAAKVVNMHVSFRVNCALDLRHLAKHLKNATYEPKKIQAVVIKLKNPKATTLVFSSGKAFTVGAACENEAKLATKKVAKMIQKLYPQVRYSNFKVNLFTGVKKFG